MTYYINLIFLMMGPYHIRLGDSKSKIGDLTFLLLFSFLSCLIIVLFLRDSFKGEVGFKLLK